MNYRYKTQDHDLEWKNALIDQNLQENPSLQRLFEYRDIDPFHDMIDDNLHQHSHDQNSNHKSSYNSEHRMIDEELEHKDNFDQQNDKKLTTDSSSKVSYVDSPKKVPHDQKNGKQRIYAKTYREKMKQKYANLQEQNRYLKKRIQKLQNQLREQGIQLNRIKFQPPKKELSSENLQKSWLQEAQILINELSLNEKKNQKKRQYWLNIPQYQTFQSKFYAERGFAGKKKLQVLNYHFNEILQNVLKDSEKYLSLVFSKSQKYDQLNPQPEFELLNNFFMQVFQDDGDLWDRLKIFTKFLHPALLQFNKLIASFSKIYQEILCCSKKIHHFVIEYYLKNMQVTKRRVQIEKFFEFYQYGKLMRRIRYKWFDWIKSLAQNEKEKKSKRKTSSTQKKKVFNERQNSQTRKSIKKKKSQ